jgi:hypothetical protein
MIAPLFVLITALGDTTFQDPEWLFDDGLLSRLEVEEIRELARRPASGAPESQSLRENSSIRLTLDSSGHIPKPLWSTSGFRDPWKASASGDSSLRTWSAAWITPGMELGLGHWSEGQAGIPTPLNPMCGGWLQLTHARLSTHFALSWDTLATLSSQWDSLFRAGWMQNSKRAFPFIRLTPKPFSALLWQPLARSGPLVFFKSAQKPFPKSSVKYGFLWNAIRDSLETPLRLTSRQKESRWIHSTNLTVSAGEWQLRAEDRIAMPRDTSAEWFASLTVQRTRESASLALSASILQTQAKAGFKAKTFGWIGQANWSIPSTTRGRPQIQFGREHRLGKQGSASILGVMPANYTETKQLRFRILALQPSSQGFSLQTRSTLELLLSHSPQLRFVNVEIQIQHAL